jgi:ribosomal protein S18 acetylase RimI-like enzyme
MLATIRILNAKSDITAFRALREEAIINSPESFGETKDQVITKSDEDYESILSAHGNGDFVMGAFINESLVGCLGFFHKQLGNLSHKGVMWGMYVQPDYRRSGIAYALIEKTIHQVRLINRVLYVQLSVVTSNTAAVSLYKRTGFTIFGTELCALRMDGRCYDEYHMQLEVGL